MRKIFSPNEDKMLLFWYNSHTYCNKYARIDGLFYMYPHHWCGPKYWYLFRSDQVDLQPRGYSQPEATANRGHYHHVCSSTWPSHNWADSQVSHTNKCHRHHVCSPTRPTHNCVDSQVSHTNRGCCQHILWPPRLLPHPTKSQLSGFSGESY